jgi:hypothetical protein
MTYTPDTPLPTDLPSYSQGIFRTNFNELNTIFSENHFTFNDATVAKRGKHNFVTLPVRAGDPGGLGATEIALFCENLSIGDPATPTELVMKRGGGSRIYLSGPEPTKASDGCSFLPGKLLIQWGTEKVPSGSSGNINFTETFSAHPYSITVTPIRSAGAGTMNIYVLDGSITSSRFRTENSGSGAHDIYWIAIGPQ